MVIEKAYAKINLALEVVKKREDGFHELKMIMLPLELHDTLTFELSDHVELVSNIDIKNNAILKTVAYMQQKYRINENVKITLDKRIPIGAGLGGGSADISATIRGLNTLFGLNKTLSELEEDANALGSDTLFCLYNKPAYVHGRGDEIEFLNQVPITDIYLFNPGIEISTKEVFLNHKIEEKTRDFSKLLEDYKNENLESFFKNTYNDLHKTAILISKELEKYEKNIKKVSKNAYMSGSGSTYFFADFKGNITNLDEKTAKIKLKYIKTKPKN